MDGLHKNIHSIKERNQKLETHYLFEIYKLANGQSQTYADIGAVAAELNITSREGDLILTRLRDKNLIKYFPPSRASITIHGINLAEEMMGQLHVEKEYAVLKYLDEKTRSNDIQQSQLAEQLSIPEEEVNYILLDFHRKQWVFMTLGNTVRIAPPGVTAFYKWQKTQEQTPLRNGINNIYHTNIYGNSSNNIGGQNNIQNAINSAKMSIDNKTKNRYKVLEEIYRLSDANSTEIVVIDEIEHNTQIHTDEMTGILSYLESKGLIDFPGGDIVQIKSGGIDEIERAKNYPEDKTDIFPPQINYITNIQGDNYGGFQQGGEKNIQNNQLNVNPDFDKAIKSIAELVRTSSLPKFKQEDLLSDLERIQNLAENDPSPELVEHAKSKINYLETALKATDLATKVAPYFPQIYAFFEGLIK